MIYTGRGGGGEGGGPLHLLKVMGERGCNNTRGEAMLDNDGKAFNQPMHPVVLNILSIYIFLLY